MKKLLIITYHWPPMGGGGVQRWLKMSKYLRNYGWEPIIFTASDAEISIPDESLLAEVPQGVETIRTPIWEPFGLYKKFTGKKADEKVQPGFLSEKDGNKWLNEIALWIRGNVFLPDAKRFWIKPARKSLLKYLSHNKVDAIVSTGPPHTTHMIALAAKEKMGTPWLADFRDPWTFIDYYDKLKLSAYANKKHHQLERKVLLKADEVVTVTWSWAEAFNKMPINKVVKVITNGYDPADFTEPSQLPLDDLFSVTHIGSMNADRNPKALWPVLGKLLKSNIPLAEKLKIKLIGPVDRSIFKSLEESGLMNYVEHIKNLPHKEVIPHLQRSQLLLLPLNDTPNISGVVPGKLYEYMGAKRPILCIGKTDGDAARIITEANAGDVIDFKDEVALETSLSKFFTSYQQGVLSVKSTSIRKYGRDKLAGEISTILNGITSS